MTKRFMNPRGKILVPIRLDEQAPQQLRACADLSDRLGLSLEVIHVSEYWVGRTWPTEMMLGGPMAGIVTSIEDQTLEDAKVQLKKLVSDHLPKHQVRSEVLLGYPAECIRAHAVTIGAELIILSANAEQYRFLPAGMSTILSLMNESPCPVLVLPHQNSGTWRGNPLKAVFADGLLPESDSNALVAYEFAAALGQTHLIHAHVNQLSQDSLKEAITNAAAAAREPIGAVDTQSIWSGAMKAIEDKLRQRAPGRVHLVEARKGKVDTKILQGSPIDAILDFANESQPDLLIFGRHRSWRQRSFSFGQVPFHLMLKSQRPVLIADH